MNNIGSHSPHTKEWHTIQTDDGVNISLCRYNGGDKGIVLMIPGICSNHITFDYDNRSLAQFISNNGYDVWIMDMRGHGKNGGKINKYWGFDSYVLHDVKCGISFILNKSGGDKLFLLGLSMGGIISYAYAMRCGQENLSGIITIGSVGVPIKLKGITFYTALKLSRYIYGDRNGNVRFFAPSQFVVRSRILKMLFKRMAFNGNMTDNEIKNGFMDSLDREPAGVLVDLLFGMDYNYGNGSWIDPKTGYNYTRNLSSIHTPILFISGGRDKMVKAKDVYKTFQLVGSRYKKYM